MPVFLMAGYLPGTPIKDLTTDSLRLNDKVVLVADMGDKIVGVISIKSIDTGKHISLLFVDEECHRRGIARKLLEKALEICRCCIPTINQITVGSSPYAVSIYKRLGFQQLGQEQVENGIRFTPMVLKL